MAFLDAQYDCWTATLRNLVCIEFREPPTFFRETIEYTTDVSSPNHLLTSYMPLVNTATFVGGNIRFQLFVEYHDKQDGPRRGFNDFVI